MCEQVATLGDYDGAGGAGDVCGEEVEVVGFYSCEWDVNWLFTWARGSRIGYRGCLGRRRSWWWAVGSRVGGVCRS